MKAIWKPLSIAALGLFAGTLVSLNLKAVEPTDPGAPAATYCRYQVGAVDLDAADIGLEAGTIICTTCTTPCSNNTGAKAIVTKTGGGSAIVTLQRLDKDCGVCDGSTGYTWVKKGDF